MKYYSIAVDGPAGAGKSTIAKLVAKKLGFVYIDTGAMYRAMGLYYMNEGLDLNDEALICANCDAIDIGISYIEGVQHVFLNGSDVSDLIRTPEVGNAASAVSVYADIRAKLVSLQQKLALSENVIMDGRDIASVVLPNADLKIYLSASVEVRAERRFKEYLEKGQECDIETIRQEIIERDERDMNRENSPLVCVEDAIVVDSSYMTIDEVTERIISLFEKVKNGDPV